MANASLTSKGQTTIPKEVRDALKLQAKDQLSFTLMPDGTVLMRAKNRKLQDLVGSANYSGPVITTEQMQLGE